MTDAMQNRKLTTIEKIYDLLLILGIILMAGTVVRVSAYTVLVSDDFWHAHTTGVIGAGFWEQIKAAWNYNAYMYKNHQGAYSLFFLALFNPVSFHSFALLRVIMIMNALLFFFSVYLLTAAVFNRLVKEKNRTLFLTILFGVVFVMTQYDAFAETFYWYTGATNYSMPVSLMNIAFVMGLKLLDGDKDKWTIRVISGAVLSFLAAGGVLPIGGTMCYVLLLMLLYQWLDKKKINTGVVLIFAASFAGTLLNVASPGYRIREGIESASERSLTGTVIYTIQVFWDNLEWLFCNKNFGLVFLVFVLCGAFLIGKLVINKKAYLTVSFLAVIVPFITIFPVVYGYNVRWMPNRCVFITIFAIDLVFGNLAAVLGYSVWSAIRSSKLKVPAMALFTVLFAVLAITTQYQPWEYTVAKINKQLFDGQYQEYHREMVEMFEDFDNHQGEDLVLDVYTYPEGMRNFYAFFLDPNPEGRVNLAVSWAYGLGSVRTSREDGE